MRRLQRQILFLVLCLVPAAAYAELAQPTPIPDLSRERYQDAKNDAERAIFLEEESARAWAINHYAKNGMTQAFAAGDAYEQCLRSATTLDAQVACRQAYMPQATAEANKDGDPSRCYELKYNVTKFGLPEQDIQRFDSGDPNNPTGQSWNYWKECNGGAYAVAGPQTGPPTSPNDVRQARKPGSFDDNWETPQKRVPQPSKLSSGSDGPHPQNRNPNPNFERKPVPWANASP